MLVGINLLILQVITLIKGGIAQANRQYEQKVGRTSCGSVPLLSSTGCSESGILKRNIPARRRLPAKPFHWMGAGGIGGSCSPRALRERERETKTRFTVVVMSRSLTKELQRFVPRRRSLREVHRWVKRVCSKASAQVLLHSC